LEKAARDKTVAETDLLPQRIKPADATVEAPPRPVPIPEAKDPTPAPAPQVVAPPPPPPAQSASDKQALEDALKSLEGLKTKLSDFRKAGTAS
jgi:hypothetical protein